MERRSRDGQVGAQVVLRIGQDQKRCDKKAGFHAKRNEMRTRHSPGITRRTAKQLLDGTAGSYPDHLIQVLSAAEASACEGELTGEQAAMAAFEASLPLEAGTLSHATNPRKRKIPSLPLANLISIKVIAWSLAGLATVGGAATAGTVAFRSSGSTSTGNPGASSLPAAGSVQTTGAGATSSARASAPEGSSEPSSLTAVQLCTELTSKVESLVGKAGGSVLTTLPVSMVTNLLPRLPTEDLTQILSTLPNAAKGTVLSEFPAADLTRVLTTVPSSALSNVFTGLPTDDLSKILTTLPSSSLGTVITTLPASTLGIVLTQLPAGNLSSVLSTLSASDLTSVLTTLPSSTASSLIGRLPTSTARQNPQEATRVCAERAAGRPSVVDPLCRRCELTVQGGTPLRRAGWRRQATSRPPSWRRLLLTPPGHERTGTKTQARHHHTIAGVDELTAAVEGARRGDPESFRTIYREAQPQLLRYLKYLVGSEAEDIASETWLQATRDLGKFHGSHRDFRRWITTIAQHRAMDHLRRASGHPSAVPVPVEDLAFVAGREDTADRAIEAITTEEALTLIASLPRDQAEAVLLRAVVGLDAKGAGQVVGKRAGAIRTAAYRGLKTLERRVERMPDRLCRPRGSCPHISDHEASQQMGPAVN
jgi:RNA polymerase sigma-70 factor, ECF subfamily